MDRNSSLVDFFKLKFDDIQIHSEGFLEEDLLRVELFKNRISLFDGNYKKHFEVQRLFDIAKKNSYSYLLLLSLFFKLDFDNLTFIYLGTRDIPSIELEERSTILTEFLQKKNLSSDELEILSILYSSQVLYKMAFIGLKESLETLKTGELINNRIDSPLATCILLYSYSQYYFRIGSFTEGINKLELGLQVALQYEFKLLQFKIYSYFVDYYIQMAEFDKVLKSFEDMQKLVNMYNYSMFNDLLNEKLSFYYKFIGEYAKSCEMKLQLVQSFKNQSIFERVRVEDYEIAQLFYVIGDLDHALEYANESLKISEEHEIMRGISSANFILGKIYYEKGQVPKALQFLKESYQKRKNLVSNFNAVEPLFHLVKINLEMGKFESANQYFQEFDYFRTDKRSSGFKIIEFLYLLSRALLLKFNKRMKYKIRALELFEELRDRKQYNSIEYLFFILLNITEILLYEYKSSEEKEVLDEIIVLSDQLYEISSKNHIPPFIIQSILIKTKLKLLTGNIDEIEKLLQEAESICVSMGLVILSTQVEKEMKKVSEEISRWKNLLNANPILIKDLAKNEFVSYLKDVQKYINI